MPEPAADTVTIAKADLEKLQRGMALLSKLDGDPRSKPLVEQAVKIHFPEVRTSSEEMEVMSAPIVQPLKDEVARLTDTVSKMVEAQAAQAAVTNEEVLDAKFQRLRTTGGYTDDGIEKIKQIMQERTIPDPEAAAALFDKLNPPPPADVPSWQPSNWELGAGTAAPADVEGLFKDPDAWADRKAGEVLNEIRLAAG